jgi:hypothetical protein
MQVTSVTTPDMDTTSGYSSFLFDQASDGTIIFNVPATKRMFLRINDSSNFMISDLGSVRRCGFFTEGPDRQIAIEGNSDREIAVMRRTTTTYEGKNFLLEAGGAAAAQSNKNGGNLLLKSGISTGTGTSKIEFYTAPAGSSGTTDNTLTLATTITSAGIIQPAGGYNSVDASAGITATIVTAQLTALGSQGSMTFKNGILTAQTAAT